MIFKEVYERNNGKCTMRLPRKPHFDLLPSKGGSSKLPQTYNYFAKHNYKKVQVYIKTVTLYNDF